MEIPMHVPLSAQEIRELANQKAQELGLHSAVSFECWVNPHLLAGDINVSLKTRNPYLQL